MSDDIEPMFEDLPDIVIQRIGNFLPFDSVVKLSLVNKQLKCELEHPVKQYRQKLFFIFRKIFTRNTSVDNWAKELYDDTENNDYIVAVKVLLLIIEHHQIDFWKASKLCPKYCYKMKGWGEYEPPIDGIIVNKCYYRKGEIVTKHESLQKSHVEYYEEYSKIFPSINLELFRKEIRENDNDNGEKSMFDPNDKFGADPYNWYYQLLKKIYDLDFDVSSEEEIDDYIETNDIWFNNSIFIMFMVLEWIDYFAHEYISKPDLIPEDEIYTTMDIEGITYYDCEFSLGQRIRDKKIVLPITSRIYTSSIPIWREDMPDIASIPKELQTCWEYFKEHIDLIVQL